MSVKKGVYCELKSCLGCRPDTVTKVSWVEAIEGILEVSHLETKVVEMLFACLLVPLFVSIGKEEVIILVVSGGVGGLSIDDQNQKPPLCIKPSIAGSCI
jgi:hypothetical protein